MIASRAVPIGRAGARPPSPCQDKIGGHRAGREAGDKGSAGRASLLQNRHTTKAAHVPPFPHVPLFHREAVETGVCLSSFSRWATWSQNMKSHLYGAIAIVATIVTPAM